MPTLVGMAQTVADAKAVHIVVLVPIAFRFVGHACSPPRAAINVGQG